MNLHVVVLKSHAQCNGGLEKYTHHLLRAFVDKGYEVTLLTTGSPPIIAGVKCHSLAPASKFTLYHLLRFELLCQKWLAHHPHDIVFGMERTTCQTHYRAGSGVHALYLQRRKMVDSFWKGCTVSLNPLHKTLLAMEKKAFESKDLKVLFTNSRMVENEILQTYATDPDKIKVVHNGVEWKKWHPFFEESFCEQKKGPHHLLFIGNGFKRKGLLFLLQALKELQKEDLILSVIGKDKESHFYADWAEKNGLKNKVRFLGYQKNVIPHYQAADALVIPSLYDPFANVTLEALAMGLFVVTSPYNGGKEVLQENTGVVIEDLCSAEALAKALKKSLDHPKTPENAYSIRQSIKELDFSNQLDKIVNLSFGLIFLIIRGVF